MDRSYGGFFYKLADGARRVATLTERSAQHFRSCSFLLLMENEALRCEYLLLGVKKYYIVLIFRSWIVRFRVSLYISIYRNGFKMELDTSAGT